jgi:protein tyrosine phosphatase (PTP) superfamily phosphohydrolase (DUF442 family)
VKDQRVLAFRTALDGLIESLDAFVRVSRWGDDEAPPEPLVTAANRLIDRLGTADRLASSRFQGSPVDVAKVTAMRSAMKRLDGAYAAYCRQSAVAEEKKEAAAQLEAEISATSDLAEQWS